MVITVFFRYPASILLAVRLHNDQHLEVGVRIHMLIAVIGTSAVLAFASVVVPPAEALSLELCCGTRGECPDNYRCCAGVDPCSDEKEGYCRTICLPIEGR